MSVVVLLTWLNHSGKSTFAKELDNFSDNTMIIENDVRRTFAEEHYSVLRQISKQKNRTFEDPDLRTFHLKTMLEFWLAHWIDICLANCHTKKLYREKLISHTHSLWHKVIVVYFDTNYKILVDRALVAKNHKNPNFYSWVNKISEIDWTQRILDNLQWMKKNYEKPAEDEWDHFFCIKDNKNSDEILQKIISLIDW